MEVDFEFLDVPSLDSTAIDIGEMIQEIEPKL